MNNDYMDAVDEPRAAVDDHTMGVILAVSVVGIILGLIGACGFAAFVGWWFG